MNRPRNERGPLARLRIILAAHPDLAKPAGDPGRHRNVERTPRLQASTFAYRALACGYITPKQGKALGTAPQHGDRTRKAVKARKAARRRQREARRAGR